MQIIPTHAFGFEQGDFHISVEIDHNNSRSPKPPYNLAIYAGIPIREDEANVTIAYVSLKARAAGLHTALQGEESLKESCELTVEFSSQDKSNRRSTVEELRERLAHTNEAIDAGDVNTFSDQFLEHIGGRVRVGRYNTETLYPHLVFGDLNAEESKIVLGLLSLAHAFLPQQN